MNVSKSTILWICFGVTLFIIFMFLFKWNYMWEGEFLGKWASVVTMISLGMTPAIYFWKKHQDLIGERSRASENLCTELDDTLNGLNEMNYPDNFKKIKFQDKNKVYFMNRIFNHDFYDSLIFSGKINFLPPNIQQPTQNTFQKIKDHNKYLRKIREIENDAMEAEDVSSKTTRYYEMLEKLEEELLSDIPTVRKKLGEF